jgi:hypothetical protein
MHHVSYLGNQCLHICNHLVESIDAIHVLPLAYESFRIDQSTTDGSLLNQMQVCGTEQLSRSPVRGMASRACQRIVYFRLVYPRQTVFDGKTVSLGPLCVFYTTSLKHD